MYLKYITISILLLVIAKGKLRAPPWQEIMNAAKQTKDLLRSN